jgi:hypothetical protein
MIENVLDRLEGIDKDRLNEHLIGLLIAAESLGVACNAFLNQNGTRDALVLQYQDWQNRIDGFYERFVK